MSIIIRGRTGQVRLKSYFFASLLGVSLLTFVVIFLLTANIYQRAYLSKTENFARGMAAQITDSLLQLMEKGWTRQELERFIQPFVAANPDTPLQVVFHRSAPLQQLFGRAGPTLPDEKAREVLASGISDTSETHRTLRHLVAVRAREACLRCHGNQRAGEVIGVLDIRQELGGIIRAITLKLGVLFLLLSPLPLFIALLIARYSGSRIAAATNLLHRNIRQVNSIRDLTDIEFSTARTEFRELNQILQEFDIFAEKIRKIAIDKHLLEFEVSLLEQFIITSDVVQDWKEHVCKLLVQVNRIMRAYALFSLFKVGEQTYNLEIFWLNQPTADTMARFDAIVRKRIEGDPRLQSFASIAVHHTVAAPATPPVEVAEADIDLQIKSVFLESPRIGGVVGIGLHSEESREEGHALVIEGILTTLINVVGSVKAIDKYTKDVEYYVTRDPLTNLFNQQVFWELAGNELARARSRDQQFAILLVDVDNFRMINDRYGHSFGDTFLQLFASQLKQGMREGDILTRHGGDRFAAILPAADLEEAKAEAARMLASVRELIIDTPDQSKVKATVSIGLAVFPDHSQEIDALFMIAGGQVFNAKRSGKNRLSIPTEEDIREAHRAGEEKSLFLHNLLVEQERIVPMFQPIMRLGDGSVDIYELLMGIRDGERIVSASSFIATAEKMGIISQLDFINIEKAFQEVRRTGYQGKLFVNLSPRSLMLGEFLANVRDAAAANGIAPASIVFEITEREAVSNRALVDKVARDLRGEGFRFAIDDFGSGFSTFHYLKLFPVDFIKIEGEFIINTPSNQVDKIFVRNIIALARDLDIETIAEHVENEEILRMARELGADYAQGYHIRAPAPAIEELKAPGRLPPCLAGRNSL